MNPNIISAAYTCDKAKTTLTMLAQAIRCGNHIVVSDRVTTIKKIQDIDGLGTDVKSIYAVVASKLVYYGDLKKKFSIYVEITSAECSLQLRKDGDQTVILIPIDYFNQELSIADKTSVIVENLTDASFYEFIGRYYISISNIIHLPLRYKGVCGGGHTTKDSVEAEIAEGHRFAICIADSDKHYPGGERGQTLKCILKVIEHADRNGICHRHLSKLIFSDQIREIENLIPMRLFKQIDKSFGDYIENIFEYNPQIFLFMDIKEGMSYDYYKRCPKCEQDFYEACLNGMGVSNVLLDKIKSHDGTLCYTDRLINGFGGNILSLAYSKLVRYGNQFNELVDPLLSDEQRRVWMYIGKCFSEWTCAIPPIRA